MYERESVEEEEKEEKIEAEKEKENRSEYIPTPKPTFPPDKQRRQSSRIAGKTPEGRSEGLKKITKKKTTSTSGRQNEKKEDMADGDDTLKGIAATLRDLQANQLKKDEVFKNVTKIVNAAIDKKVTKRIDKLDDRTDKIEKRLTKLEAGGVRGGANADPNRAEFLAARKSLIITLCEADPNTVNTFLLVQLGMPKEVVSTLFVRSCVQVFDKNLPQHRRRQADKRPKVKIELKTIDQRDLVMSFASNLDKGVNMDMVVPCHLKVTAMRLEHHAFKIRQESKGMAGGGQEQICKNSG